MIVCDSKGNIRCEIVNIQSCDKKMKPLIDIN